VLEFPSMGVEQGFQTGTELAVYADLKTHRFLIEAIDCQAHNIFPSHSVSARNWVRDLNVTGIYFGTNLRLEEIGSLLGIAGENKREEPRLIVKRTLKQLWQNCPLEVQQMYPLEVLKVRKPTDERLRNRFSTLHNGRREQILELIAAGLTSSQEIAQAVGKPQKSVSSAITHLRKIGLGPESVIERNRSIREKIKSARTDEEIKEALAAANLIMHRRFSKLFSPISQVAIEAGFRFRNDELVNFVSEMQNHSIPFRLIEKTVKSGESKGEVMRYYFVLKQQEQRVQEVFEKSAELARFKRLKTLKQVAGPRVELPSTAQTGKKERYVTVGEELKRLKGKRLDFLVDCPVPVFKFAATYLVAKDDYSVFTADLEEFRRDLQV